jgi:hypothetical protein
MTQQNQLGTVLGTFLDTEMMPSIVLDLQKKYWNYALRKCF